MIIVNINSRRGVLARPALGVLLIVDTPPALIPWVRDDSIIAVQVSHHLDGDSIGISGLRCQRPQAVQHPYD